ncbi:HDL174Cp [Eremothecium sinecaudum]|uniref:Rab proteins geranylgeranyltransferase component A n=1 Tax=Eremothecium sinecaudum TaxID=45286 RepID=A0A0X8HSE2_9SACH|nr:HDL174Cp [Eremothecium sinecaudum]AMD20570.1 HDL174Cp [Eremothecium sinecaudum]
MNNTERRVSMAERRPSSILTTEHNKSGMIVPHLAGLEDPLPETTPEKVDVVIVGTGLVESILAAALSWQGSSVLHVDSNSYYGDSSATLTIDQLKNWVAKVNNNEYSGCYQDARLYVSSMVSPQGSYSSRDFGIDLSPKILFAKSDLLSILTKSRVHHYLEFRSLSDFHTYENDNFEKLNNSKQEIFTDPTLPLMTKRNLMRFIKFVLDWETQPELWEPFVDKPLSEFLEKKFKLEKPHISELIFSIGLCYTYDVTTPNGLQRIRRYLTSFDVYGPFPVLYSKYGGPGEIAQGFCRSAAVAGATYKLQHKLVSFDPTSKVATFQDGSRALVTEKVVISPTQRPENSKNLPPQPYEVQHLTCVVEKDCAEWFGENRHAAIVVFPPSSLKTNNKVAVQVLIQSSGSETCPNGTCVWYLTTTETGKQGELDLDATLEAMEASIIRESSDIPHKADVFEMTPTGQYIVNSVKLGQSFIENAPQERLHFLVKLYYRQFTSTSPFNVVHPSLFNFQTSEKYEVGASDNGILYTAMPSGEISYDEAITAAKVLYDKIVGSDDDFFDIDFEDEEDQEISGKVYNESAITDDDDEADILDAEVVEFAGEMEI